MINLYSLHLSLKPERMHDRSISWSTSHWLCFFFISLFNSVLKFLLGILMKCFTIFVNITTDSLNVGLS